MILHILGIVIACIGGIGGAALSVMSAFTFEDQGIIAKKNVYKFLLVMLVSIVLGVILI